MWTRVVVALAGLAACGDNFIAPPDAAIEIDADPRPDPYGHIELKLEGDPDKPRVLVYTFENFWRHPSNIDCRGAIVDMHSSRGYTVATTNDPAAINAHQLADYDVLVFAITSGSGITPDGQRDLEAWIRAGGGVVGFHSATMTEPFWQFYVDEIGTRFAGHVNGLFEATVHVDSATHPITAGLPDIVWTDEWYFFTQRPETIPGATMLLSLDESTLPADYPAMYKQGYHPIAWVNDRFGGRMFYSAWGHAPEAWHDPEILEITERAIEWAAHKL
jgi:type 1 glutamine amidotransferase